MKITICGASESANDEITKKKAFEIGLSKFSTPTNEKSELLMYQFLNQEHFNTENTKHYYKSKLLIRHFLVLL